MNNILNQEFTIQQAMQSWNLIDKAIEIIHCKQTQQLSYEELYRNAYQLVVNRHGDMVYNQLQLALKKIFTKIIEQLSLQYDLLLQQIIEAWNDVKFLIKCLSSIFLYMDKNYVQLKQKQPVKILGYEIFRNVLFNEKGEVFQNILHIILDMIRRERDGEMVDRSHLKQVISMIVNFINSNPL